MKNIQKNHLSEKIECYHDEIYKRNCANLLSFTFGGMIITASIVFIGSCVFQNARFIVEYVCFFAYMLLAHLISRYCVKHQVPSIRLVYYVVITPVMIGGILMGSFLDTSQPAITIMVLLCVMTLFIIDKPWRIFTYMICVAAVFAICSYLSKDSHLFASDMIDLVIYTSIGLGVNYFMLSDQLRGVENFYLVEYKSERDSLTNLYNRGGGEKRVRESVEMYVPGAFMIMDIDNFKQINDTFGHQIGDEVICEVARVLKSSFKKEDIVFRLGGDEFAVFADNMSESSMCVERFNWIKKEMSQLKTSVPGCCHVGLSMGCTIFNGQQKSFEQIYKETDNALYEAKKNGKGNIVVKVLRRE